MHVYMTEAARTKRPLDGPEKPMLAAFLDFQRDTLVWKVSGLADAALRRTWTASGLTLLGLVKHLAYVERWWFQIVFAGRDVPIPWTRDDPDADFRLDPTDTADSVVAFYRAEIAESRAITDAAALDERARNPVRPVTLRRVLIHMIEETARHNGHADIFRELADGQTGE